MLNTENCDSQLPTGGITMEITGAMSVMYGENGLPSPTRTATTAEGTAFGLNVTPGPVTITATLEGTSTVYATFTVNVRPDTVTLVYLAPAP